MGLFNFLFSQQRQGPPAPPLGMPPPGMGMRMGMDRRGEEIQELEERVARLESDLEQAAVIVESLVRLLEEGGTLKRDAVAARARELGAEGVEEMLGAAPEAAAAAAPSAPVQPTFKKPFVAKRKWDEAAGPAGPGTPPEAGGGGGAG